LGAVLAEKLQCNHFDIDQFFWLPTDPPYQTIRSRQERQVLLSEAVASCPSWTLSGNLCGWGDPFVSQFNLAVFICIPSEVRIASLRAREAIRYGAAILPGGVMHKQHQEFLQWAAGYDNGGLDMRSRQLHEHWLATLPCPVIRLEGGMLTEFQLNVVLEHIQRAERTLQDQR
jgi:hypothetical protein